MKHSRFTVFFFALILIMTNGCKDKTTVTQIEHESPQFSEYITAYTAGVINIEESVQIRFAQLPGIDKTPTDGLVSITPKIEGTFYWSNESTLTFIPDPAWTPGQTYRVAVNLGNIERIPEGTEPFTYTFQVRQPWYEVVDIQLLPSEKQSNSQYDLRGEIRFSNHFETDEIKKCISISDVSGNTIQWQFNVGENQHVFLVSGISRKNKDHDVVVRINGVPLGIGKDYEKKLTVPAAGEFKVMNTNVVENPQQKIIIEFSEYLDKSQEKTGLVQFNPVINFRQIIDKNRLIVIPEERQSGEYNIRLFNLIKSQSGSSLASVVTQRVLLQNEKPQVALLNSGVIMPSSQGLKFAFKAVNVRALQLRIAQIFEDNVPYFLQENQLDDTQQIKRAGRLVHYDLLHLSTDKSINYNEWNTYSFNLEDYIDVESGAIYRIYLSLDPRYSEFPCVSDTFYSKYENTLASWSNEINESDQDFWNYYGYEPEVDYQYYQYRERKDPCKLSYFLNRSATVSQSVIGSNIGLIAKADGSDKLFVAVSDLLTSQAKPKVSVEAFTYQNTSIGSAKTNKDGFAEIELSGKPFLLVAKDGKDVAYLRLQDGAVESVSMFEVEGSEPSGGIGGFLYGDRGVWRPGDSIYLNFILQDKENQLPTGHPVIFEFYNPKYQRVERRVSIIGESPFFDFRTKTITDAPTGNWLARIKVGNYTVEKTIRVETIRPNRLKMDIVFPSDNVSVADGKINGKIKSEWLHGAVASGLEADVQLKINSGRTTFDGFENYKFDNEALSYQTREYNVFKGKLDQNGEANFTKSIYVKNAPGKLQAQFINKVFESGGAFSIDRKVEWLSPYDQYVGIKVPEGSGWRGSIQSQDDKNVALALVDAAGKPISGDVEINIYKISWRWWYDHNRGNDLSNFMQSQDNELVHKADVTINNGRTFFKLPDLDSYGQHVLVAKDKSGSHIATHSFRYGWNQDGEQRESSEMLQFKLDKTVYQSGENIEVEIPSNGEGHFIVSLEKADQVLEWKRVKAENNSTKVNFVADIQLVPNAYVYVAYIQPHAQTANDLPIRLYGVHPVFVEDDKTHISPVIDAADSWEPEQEVSIKISERNGQAMEYTLVAVDEGLLNLTRFNTPDPWTHFHKKQALAVKTWDLYDHVIGAYAGEMAALLAVGGDGEAVAEGQAKANRFPPIVKYLGRHTLKKNKENIHEFILPNYVGELRIMAIAATSEAYGHAEASVKVKKPLMALASLPRVLGPGEEIQIPVTVFAMEDNIKNVNVSIQTSGLVRADQKSQNIRFNRAGDQVVYFPVKVSDRIGVEKINITAEGHGHKATTSVEIDVRAPNPPVHKTESIVLEPGQTHSMTVNLPGMEGTSAWSMEVSSGVSLDFGEKAKRLFGYPYGCVEQTTSKVFPQLFVMNLMELSEEEKEKIEANIEGGIERIYSFQIQNGGIGYWPNSTTASPWGSNYAGHFILEAKKMGYAIPEQLLPKWIKYQKEVANNWLPADYGLNDHGYYWSHDLSQAYRLYTLALAGEAQIGAMNRLREKENLGLQAAWRLALAYILIGREEVAQDMVVGLNTEVQEYKNYGSTFGSSMRDQAMILETLIGLKNWDQAYKVAEIISKKWNRASWYSTQTSAYTLMSFSKFLLAQKKSPLHIVYRVNNGQAQELQQENSMLLRELDMLNGSRQQFQIENKGEQRIFVKLHQSGIPMVNQEVEANKNLIMSVTYTDLDGNEISSNNLERGRDFYAVVSVKNPGVLGNYSEMALTQIFPSGWEIHNERLDAVEGSTKFARPQYQDIRDDRVYTYFNLRSGETKKFGIRCTATFPGNYYQPSVFCENMYDKDIYALKPGKRVTVSEKPWGYVLQNNDTE